MVGIFWWITFTFSIVPLAFRLKWLNIWTLWRWHPGLPDRWFLNPNYVKVMVKNNIYLLILKFNHINIIFCSVSSSDVANVIQACYGETPPPIILIGHGVGGAIAVHTASHMLLPSTVGLVAIDVVEGDWMHGKHSDERLLAWALTEVMGVFFSLGSAMEALHSIQNFLKGRPKSFKSVDHAIEWRFA